MPRLWVQSSVLGDWCGQGSKRVSDDAEILSSSSHSQGRLEKKMLIYSYVEF